MKLVLWSKLRVSVCYPLPNSALPCPQPSLPTSPFLSSSSSTSSHITVIRTTTVKPMMRVATYSCEVCSTEMYQEITGPSFMPAFLCTSTACKRDRRNARLHLQVRGSKFEKFQEIRIQEMVRRNVYVPYPTILTDQLPLRPTMCQQVIFLAP